MDVLISKQAAIDTMCELMRHWFGCDSKDEIREIKRELDKLPSALQWILCSERLPKNDDWKIITILDESGDTPSRYTDFGWYLEAANCWIVEAEQRTDVIAWMPLPKPYKEVTE